MQVSRQPLVLHIKAEKERDEQQELLVMRLELPH